MLFLGITTILGLYTRNMIKKDITGPIIVLKKCLKLNQNESSNDNY